MILRRLGNKKRLAGKIIQYFPKHDIYFEPFFGAGGMFFNKPLAKYNYVNDNDSEVYNLYKVLSETPEEFRKALELTPQHHDLFQYWKKNIETEPVKKAVRFVFLSNYTFLGKMDCLRYTSANDKKNALYNIDKTIEMLKYVQFHNTDFEKFLKSWNFKCDADKPRTFVYCDPPYLNTENNYANGFTEDDTIRLFDCLHNFGTKYAVSEFNNQFITDLAKERGLNVITIGERRSLKNRSTEILITNYEVNNELF